MLSMGPGFRRDDVLGEAVLIKAVDMQAAQFMPL
jgi:hypothetical protein